MMIIDNGVIREMTDDEISGLLGICLDDLKAQAVTRVNSEAGSARAKYITVIPGQEQTYAIKAAEAAAYDGNPTGSYPYLTAEAAAVGTTVAELAAEVNATATAWTAINAEIEAKRRGATVAILAATAATEVQALTVIDWP